MSKYSKHEVAQGVSAWVAMLSGGVALPFTLEFVGVLNELEYTSLAQKQADILPYVAGSLSVLALAAVVGVGSYVVDNKFWLRRSLSMKLEKLALAVRGGN